MAGTDKRQQQAQEAARQLADQQVRSQEMARQRQELVRQQRETARQRIEARQRQETARQQQETARRAAVEAARLRQSSAARNNSSLSRTTDSSRRSPSSDTEEIEKRLVKDVEDIMHQESFGDLVYVDTKNLPRPRDSGRQRPESVGRGSAIRSPGYRRAAEEEEEWDDDPSSETLRHWGKVGQWFQMFCWMHIPIFGFWYMVVTAFRKKNPEEKRAFAKAFLIYRLLVLLLAFTLLYALYRMGLDFIEQILSYVDMHSGS